LNEEVYSKDPGSPTGFGRKPQFEGLPFRGAAPDLKNTDPSHMQPKICYEVHVRQFDLKNEKHLEEYENIFQQVAEGSVTVSFEERVYDDDIKSWRVLLRYYDQFYVASSDNQGRVKNGV